MIAINEIFLSIQGEGSYMGTPCFFIRVQGCDYNCEWCDTKEAIPNHKNNMLTYEQILDYLSKFNTEIKTVILTGGNPLFHENILDLISILKNNGYRIHIETQGTYLHRIMDNLDNIYHISISPKIDVVDDSFKQDIIALTRTISQHSISVDIKYPCSNTEDVVRYMDFCREITGRKYIMVRSSISEDYDKKSIQFIQKVLPVITDDFSVQPQVHRLIYGDKKGV